MEIVCVVCFAFFVFGIHRICCRPAVQRRTNSTDVVADRWTELPSEDEDRAVYFNLRRNGTILKRQRTPRFREAEIIEAAWIMAPMTWFVYVRDDTYSTMTLLSNLRRSMGSWKVVIKVQQTLHEPGVELSLYSRSVWIDSQCALLGSPKIICLEAFFFSDFAVFYALPIHTSC